MGGGGGGGGGGWGGGGVLWISSGRDDRRILGGLKFWISGFFGVGKYWQVFFGQLDLSRDFFCAFKTNAIFPVISFYNTGRKFA